jgi:hypothetical protein
VNGFEWAGIKKVRKAIRTRGVEIDDGHLSWQKGAAHRVAKCKSHLRIVQDKCDGLLREFDIRGDCDKPGTHNGEVCDQHFGAVARKDRDPIAAPKAPGHERSRARIHLPVDLAVRQCPRVLPIATVDQGRICFGRGGIGEVAKVNKIAHVELPNAGTKCGKLSS